MNKLQYYVAMLIIVVGVSVIVAGMTLFFWHLIGGDQLVDMIQTKIGK